MNYKCKICEVIVLRMTYDIQILKDFIMTSKRKISFESCLTYLKHWCSNFLFQPVCDMSEMLQIYFFQPVSDKKNLSVATDKFELISHQVWISSILREMIKHLALFLPLSKPELPQKWLHTFLMHFGVDNIQTTVWNNMIMIF